MDLKKVGDYQNKLDKMMPLDKFKNYFVKTLYDVHKVVGKHGSDMVYGSVYIVDSDVQDAYHGEEYDYVAYILENMKENIELAKRGELGIFRFDHYSLLMHLILYKNMVTLTHILLIKH